MKAATILRAGRAAGRLRPGRRLPFPLGAATWPGGVERPPAERRTGLDYDTAWARRPAARYARGFLVEWVMKPVVAAVAAPRIRGLDRIEHLDAPVIFAANHHSHLDTPLLLTALPDRFRHRAAVAAAADYFFDSRLKGAASALAMSAIPVERQRVSRRSADLSAEVLDEGWSLVIFPEGGRSPDGWGQEFRGGAAYLSVRSGRPVVPVHIEGTSRILPKGARRLVPATVHVTFGAPLSPDEGEDVRRLAARIERAVAVLADEQATDWWMARKRAAAGVTPSLGGPPAGRWRRQWALGDRTGRSGTSGRRRTTRDWP